MEINTAGHHLLDMINDVLDLSKIEAGRYDLANEIVELGMVVRSCIGMLRPRANEGGVRIENRLDGNRIAVRGDARALKQIVLNLLSNAVKFTPQGGVASLHIEHSGEGVGSGCDRHRHRDRCGGAGIAGPAVPAGGRLHRTQISAAVASG